MADKKISELNNLVTADSSDLLAVVDVSEPETKSITINNLKNSLAVNNVDNTSDANKPISTATQTALDLKSNINSPTFTGTPSAPTTSTATNTTQIATTAFVQSRIGELNTGVSSVSGTAPITISGTSPAPVVGINNATISLNGAMSASDKIKLDGIQDGAQAVTTATVNDAMEDQTMTAGTFRATSTIRGRTRTDFEGMTLLSEVAHSLHPEDEGTSVLPYYANDISYLLQRGGSLILSTPPRPQNANLDNLFDNGTERVAWNVSEVGPIGVVVEVVLHRVFQFACSIGFSSGSPFRAKDFTIEVRNAVTEQWSEIANKTEYPAGTFVRSLSAGSSGIDRIRYNFSNFQASSTFRISQLFILNFASNLGREVFVTRDSSSMLGKLTVGANFDTPQSAVTTLAVAGDIGPHDDGVGNCGTATRRWAQVYANDSTIQTSDARLKTPVRPLIEAERECSKALIKEIGMFKWLSSVANKGDAAREHIGLTVQTVIDIMNAHGLDYSRYGIVCYDEWEDRYETTPAVIDEETGEELEPERTELVEPAGNRYSLRYNEMIMFMLAGLCSQFEDSL